MKEPVLQIIVPMNIHNGWAGLDVVQHAGGQEEIPQSSKPNNQY